MKSETFESVWDAICDTPEEAANMKAHAELMLNIRERVKAWDLTQEEAAKRLHLTRPRMSDRLRGKNREILARFPGEHCDRGGPDLAHQGYRSGVMGTQLTPGSGKLGLE